MLEQPSLRRKAELKKAEKPCLSDFLDYREYLAAFYDYKRFEFKNSIRPYSYANFSAAAGIKSPNYLKMIIEGRRNLSDEMTLKFAKALKLTKSETQEFVELVKYTQASESSERNQHLRQLSKLRVKKGLESGQIDRKTWERVPGWVAYVIHAMIPPHGMTGDPDKILKLFRGKALMNEVDEALKALLTSGLIEKNSDDGRIFKKAEFMDSQDGISPELVRKLQAELMYLGLESLFRDAPNTREMGSLTLSLNAKEFEDIKFTLRKLKKTLMTNAMTKSEKQPGERVFQVNLQLYPLTEPID